MNTIAKRSVAMVFGLLAAPLLAQESSDAVLAWVQDEFQPSTLTVQEQMDEMRWFARAALPFRGMTLKVVSETIATHEYESKVLAQAFFDITGIEVLHDLIGEGDVIEKLLTRLLKKSAISS